MAQHLPGATLPGRSFPVPRCPGPSCQAPSCRALTGTGHRVRSAVRGWLVGPYVTLQSQPVLRRDDAQPTDHQTYSPVYSPPSNFGLLQTADNCDRRWIGWAWQPD
eukprot:scaffold40347_cov66-Phaeocystis_antarctica.AAC.1